MTTHTLAVLRGDGVGPEVTDAALSVLGACVPVKVREARIGGEAIDAAGDPLPPETLDVCRTSDAVLLGAVGGPKWSSGPRGSTGVQSILSAPRSVPVAKARSTCETW